MSFQWLTSRIAEEQERRKREAQILDRLPRALDELCKHLRECIQEYQEAFGPESAEISANSSQVRVTAREQRGGKWEPIAKVEIRLDLGLPGFQVDRAGRPLAIEVGLLAGDKIYFRDQELDQYVTIEELTHRILDRGLFPKLPE